MCQHHWLFDPPWTAVDEHIKGVCTRCGAVATLPATFEACEIDHRKAYHEQGGHNHRVVQGHDGEISSVIENFWKSKLF